MFRAIAALLLIWLAGFVAFAVNLPEPSSAPRTDGIVVLTGGPGRVSRGLRVLAAGRAKRMLVSGVDPVVRRQEFEAVQAVPEHLSSCCIDLGKEARDTISNATEAAGWAKAQKYKSVRLVTSNWHMRRAAFEFSRVFDDKTEIVIDAVPSSPGLVTMSVEYNKYLARRAVAIVEDVRR